MNKPAGPVRWASDPGDDLLPVCGLHGGGVSLHGGELSSEGSAHAHQSHRPLARPAPNTHTSLLAASTSCTKHTHTSLLAASTSCTKHTHQPVSR